ncbi:probable leucine-rich repeat receptor-like protein kinase At5g63930 isoform X2 [Rhodamnia argentea]|nr:probable leucine-rich repeat receptor-like protein kinase At5g63930 isoform X2 [Rhodamnia argentea]
MGFAHLLLIGFVLLALDSRGLVRGNAELGALMEIKASLDPENKILTSWTSNGDPCGGSFDGVACNERLKVANISLQGMGLAGKVSPAVAQLKCLSGLYLHYNSLTGEIPRELANLTELTDLYLNVNYLTGRVPSEIGSMASLQVLQLCCNRLNGTIPPEMGSLKKLSVLALQHNKLSGDIPVGLGNLQTLKRLDLSFNQFTGQIPVKVANIPELQALDVQNNSLSGLVPPALKKLEEGFQYQNNTGLCGFGFPLLRNCNGLDDANVNDLQPIGLNTNKTVPIPQTANVKAHCNRRHCSSPSKLPQAALVAGIVSVTVTLVGAGLLTSYRYRRGKQKIGSTADASDSRLSSDHSKDLYSRSASPLVCLEYSSGWDPLDDGRYGNGLSLQAPRYTLEEVESATQYFSEVNLLGRSTFSSVYRGILRDGTPVAIRSINVTSCKSEEAEFVNGLNLVTSLRHQNLIRLRGVCCSKGRGECFLVYDFAPKGTLSQYLDLEDGSIQVLDWPTRVSIIKGTAEGIGYLHSSEADRPAVVHQNISVEKILIDQQLNPLIMDSGLPKLLADDVIYSALKISAAMGYLAPEYITTGRFTEKSDVFAFGVIIFQILSGKRQLSSSMRLAAESCAFENFIDCNLKGNFTEPEAAILGKIALGCTSEFPDSRPTIIRVIEELNDW